MLKTQIPRRIIRLRQLHGWSARALSERAGVAASTLQEIEAGKAWDVKLSTLEAIAGAFRISVAELLSTETAVCGRGCGRIAEYLQEQHEAHQPVAALASRLGLHVDSVQHILNQQYESLRLARI